MARKIKCVVCGEIFVSDTWNASICSDECRKLRNRQRMAKEREAIKQGSEIYDARKKPPKFKSTMRQLTKDAVEAKKEGMSYGRYIAQKNNR